MERGVGLGLATNIDPSNWSSSGKNRTFLDDFVQFHFIEIQSPLEFPLEHDGGKNSPQFSFSFNAPYIFPGWRMKFTIFSVWKSTFDTSLEVYMILLLIYPSQETRQLPHFFFHGPGFSKSVSITEIEDFFVQGFILLRRWIWRHSPISLGMARVFTFNCVFKTKLFFQELFACVCQCFLNCPLDFFLWIFFVFLGVYKLGCPPSQDAIVANEGLVWDALPKKQQSWCLDVPGS